MDVVSRAKAILQAPRAEWPLIAAEPATEQGLFTGYAAILALLPLVGTVLAGLLFTGGLIVALPPRYWIALAIVSYVAQLAVLFVMAVIVAALAPNFGGAASRVQALKWLVYACTPVWIAGLFTVVPVLGALLVIAALVYAVYLLYLGATPVLGVPHDKAAGFVAVVALIWILVGWIVNTIVAKILAAALLGPLLIGVPAV